MKQFIFYFTLVLLMWFVILDLSSPRDTVVLTDEAVLIQRIKLKRHKEEEEWAKENFEPFDSDSYNLRLDSFYDSETLAELNMPEQTRIVFSESEDSSAKDIENDAEFEAELWAKERLEKNVVLILSEGSNHRVAIGATPSLSTLIGNDAVSRIYDKKSHSLLNTDQHDDAQNRLIARTAAYIVKRKYQRKQLLSTFFAIVIVAIVFFVRQMIIRRKSQANPY